MDSGLRRNDGRGDGGEGGATAGLGSMGTRFFAALRMTCGGMGGGMGPHMREETDWGAGGKRKGAGRLARPLWDFRWVSGYQVRG